MSEPRVPAPRPSRQSALLLWSIAGAGLILVNLLGSILSPTLAKMDSNLASLLLNLCYYLPFTALPTYLLARRTPGLWAAYRPYPISLLSVISIVSLGILGVFFATDITTLWSIPLQELGLDIHREASIAIPESARGLALCILYSAALPAVCEEFVFRGAMLSALERNGTKRAVIATAALFALLHGSPSGLPAHFLLGLILGWLVVYCDSIYAGLIFHTTHNAATLILQFLINRSSSVDAVSKSARLLDVVGGLPGVLEVLCELLLIGAMILLSLRMFRLTSRLRGVEIVPRRHERLRGGELALLIAGLILSGLLYGTEIAAML